MGFQSLDEMYAAIGYGGCTALKAVNRIRDELLQISRVVEPLADLAAGLAALGGLHPVPAGAVGRLGGVDLHDVEVVCKDRDGLLVDISTAISAGKVSVTSLNSHTTTRGGGWRYRRRG